MDLVVDTNILFSFFKEDSVTRRLIKTNKLILYTPEFAKEELLNYKELIKERYSLSESDFETYFEDLNNYVLYVPEARYSVFFPVFKDFKDQKDIDFLALAFFFGLPLWTNDKGLKNQTKIGVLNTKEVIDILL